MERLLWMDLETEGLYPHPPKDHRIFEIGAIVTDLNLNILGEWSTPIWHGLNVPMECDDFIVEMHSANGLFNDMVHKGVSLMDAETSLLRFLEAQQIPLDRTMPMHGNSIRLDRDFISVWLPFIDRALSYRIVDVSTLKEMCRRYRPAIYAVYKETFPDDDKAHRVLDDCKHSIAEFKFYLNAMGWL